MTKLNHSLFRKRPKIRPSKNIKALIIHCLIILLIFGGLGKLFSVLAWQGLGLFLAVAGSSILLGLLHHWALGNVDIWEENQILPKVISFTFIVNTLSAVVFFFLFLKNGEMLPAFLMASNTILFSLPVFAQIAFKRQHHIPAKKYEGTVFSSLEDVRAQVKWGEDPTTGLIVEFENTDDATDLPKQAIRFLAPNNLAQIPFEVLFKSLLLHYNEVLNPNNPISTQFYDELNYAQPYEWWFFEAKPAFMKAPIIDPKLDIESNKIHFYEWSETRADGTKIELPKVSVIKVRRAKKAKIANDTPPELAVSTEAIF